VKNKNTAEHAMFSTAAIAMRQQPPAKVARMITLAICTMAAATLAYACLVSMDIVVTVQGRVSASGKSKVIQPLEAGVVKVIAVKDGQRVKAGDLLLELDATATLADRDRLQREFWETQADVGATQCLAVR
jgi:hemolysin D